MKLFESAFRNAAIRSCHNLHTQIRSCPEAERSTSVNEVARAKLLVPAESELYSKLRLLFVIASAIPASAPQFSRLLSYHILCGIVNIQLLWSIALPLCGTCAAHRRSNKSWRLKVGVHSKINFLSLSKILRPLLAHLFSRGSLCNDQLECSAFNAPACFLYSFLFIFNDSLSSF